MKHTPEPWEHVRDDDNHVYREDVGGNTDPTSVAKCDSPDTAARIVACVNALAGLNPKAVRDLIEAAKNALAIAELDHDSGDLSAHGIELIADQLRTALAALGESK